MTTALFINDIYDAALSEMLAAQESRRGGISFLQPHKGQIISMLRNAAPSPKSPIRLCTSTSVNLSNICYTAEIVGWESPIPSQYQLRETPSSRLAHTSRRHHHGE